MSAETHSKSSNRPRSVAVFAMIMAAGTMGSRFLGLARDMAFAALFSRYITDAWIAAFRLPNLFRRLLGEGSLSSGFIPVFVDTRARDGETTGPLSRELLNGVYSILLATLCFLTALGIVFAGPILSLVVGGENYMSIPGKYELTVQMAKVMFGFLFFISQFAYFMAILNAIDRYAVAALAPCLFNIAMIVSCFVPVEWQAYNGQALAWGVLIGGALQAFVLIPSLIKHGVMPRIRFNLSKDVLRVIRNMVPAMLGMGILQTTSLVNTYFASSLPQGTHSWLYWADRILELPLSLFAVSLGSALLPTLSRHWAQKNYKMMSETANFHIRLIGFVSVPSCVGLYFLAEPLVDVIYRRGKFDIDDLVQTAAILQVYAFMLIVASGVRVTAPALYAVQNTWYPALVSVIALVFHLFAAPILMAEYGVTGLALSSLFSACINLGLLSIGFRLWVGTLEFLTLVKSFAKFGLASFGMYLVFPLYALMINEAGVPKVLALLTTIVLASLVYFGLCWSFRSEEFYHTLGQVLMKLRRRLAR